MPESAQLELELSNDLSEISRLSDAVDGFCAQHRIEARATFNLNLVLEEVVANIIKYAFCDSERHVIHVNLRLTAGQVQGEVRDSGQPFDPLTLPPPDLDLDLEHRMPGGLGVHFLKTLMDQVLYTRENGQNCLRFLKKIAN